MSCGYREIEPVAFRRTLGFWDSNCDDPEKHRGGVMEMEAPIWREADTKRGEELRAVRMQRALSLGDVARLTGLTVVQVSRLERGGATVDTAAYKWAISAD